jgi:hypothetical protein
MVDPEQIPLERSGMKTQLIEVGPVGENGEKKAFGFAFIITPTGGDAGDGIVSPAPSEEAGRHLCAGKDGYHSNRLFDLFEHHWLPPKHMFD